MIKKYYSKNTALYPSLNDIQSDGIGFKGPGNHTSIETMEAYGTNKNAFHRAMKGNLSYMSSIEIVVNKRGKNKSRQEIEEYPIKNVVLYLLL